MRTRLSLLIASLLFTTLPATAAPLPEGASVRVDSMSFEPGWHPGTIKRSNGCTMVIFKKPVQGNYTSVALVALDKLQIAKGNNWEDADLKALLAEEPDECREDMAD